MISRMERARGTLGIIGASGFLGSELAHHAQKNGWDVCGFSRQARTPEEWIPEWRAWNDLPDFSGIAALVNLAGESIAQRWTDSNKEKFHTSRIGTTLIVQRGIAALPEEQRPKVLVNGSAVGIYGDQGDTLLQEDAILGSDYLARLCQEWEAAAHAIGKLGVRIVKWRTGVVLGSEGEAFKKMVLPFRIGVGGRLGSGKQWMPWIHVHDLAAGILHAVEHPSMAGQVNGSAPEPERNIDFTRKLARALNRPAVFPVPRFALKLLLGDFGDAILASQRAVPEALLESGFRFRYPTLDQALEELI